MKIVNIILTSQNGGAEQAFIDYSAVLKNLGHEVLTIVKTDAPYADKISLLGIPVKKITNHFGYHDFFAVKNIKKILEEFNADAVMAHAGRSMTLVRKALKKIRNKKIFFIAVNHSMNVKRSIGADLIFSVNKLIFYRTIDAGQSENTSFVISNAIDLTDAVKVVPKINLQGKEVVVLGVIARLDKAKGFRYAIRAIKKLEELSDRKFVLKIAGTGPREAFLRNLAKELNVENKVEFLGWIKSKKEFFDAIDILIFPSQRETFGLVLLEGMKFCKPIISTAADGPKEILQNEVNALMVEVEPLDTMQDRIALAVVRMINEPELVNKMIENSFVKLQEKFSYKSLEKRLGEVVGAINN